jgi:hypothetical protein
MKSLNHKSMPICRCCFTIGSVLLSTAAFAQPLGHGGSPHPDRRGLNAPVPIFPRAEGFTYVELCRLFDDHTSRVAQVLDGTLHPGSWEAAVDRLVLGQYWHPRIVALVLSLGGPAPLIIAAKASDPAHRGYQQTVRRIRKLSIPFCRRHETRLGTAA